MKKRVRPNYSMHVMWEDDEKGKDKGHVVPVLPYAVPRKKGSRVGTPFGSGRATPQHLFYQFAGSGPGTPQYGRRLNSYSGGGGGGGGGPEVGRNGVPLYSSVQKPPMA